MPIRKDGSGKILYTEKVKPLDSGVDTGVELSSQFAIADDTDQLKQIKFDASSLGSNSTVIIKGGAAQAGSTVTITLPSTDTTLGNGDVDSVNGQTGDVVLDTDDVGEGVANLYHTTARVNSVIDTRRGAANGVASLDANGLVPSAQLPPLATTETFVVASQAAMLALSAQTGDFAVRTDVSKTFILSGTDPTVLSDWTELQMGGDVLSVNGQTGTVSLGAADVGAQASDADLSALAALATTGLIARTGAGTAETRTLTAPASGISVSNGDGAAGNPTLALANDLAALEAMSGTGIVARTASETYAQRSIVAPAAGITIADGDGVAGNPTLALANDLAALEGLASSGLIARTGDGSAATRTITGPAAGITVSNGDGVSGNPTLALANDLAALEGLASNGLIARTGDGGAATRTLTGPAAGISVSNGDGVSGNPTLALANDLAAYEGLSTTGLVVRSGDGLATTRTITAGSSKVSISNGDGVSGNPSVDITEANLTLTNIGGTLSVAKGGTGQTEFTDGQLLIGNTATGGLSKATLTAGSNVTITNGNGSITIASSGGGGGGAKAFAQLTTATSTTATVPIDDTVPQNSEGTEILTCTITPTSASGKLNIWYKVPVHNASSGVVMAMLFRDSTADAISVDWVSVSSSHDILEGFAQVDSTSTSATTFKLRVGTQGGTLNINGTGARYFGGALYTSILIIESP